MAHTKSTTASEHFNKGPGFYDGIIPRRNSARRTVSKSVSSSPHGRCLDDGPTIRCFLGCKCRMKDFVGGDICLDSVNGRSFLGAANGFFTLAQGLLFQHGSQWRSLVHPCPPGRLLIFFFHSSFRFFFLSFTGAPILTWALRQSIWPRRNRPCVYQGLRSDVIMSTGLGLDNSIRILFKDFSCSSRFYLDFGNSEHGQGQPVDGPRKTRI